MSHASSPGTGRALGPENDPTATWPEYSVTTAPGTWQPDILGAGYSYTTLPLGSDAEGELCATLVRHIPDSRGPAHARSASRAPLGFRLGNVLRRLFGQDPASTVRARTAGPAGRNPVGFVLALHGWSDYFYNTELAGYWSDRGYAFYALDFRRYGRSLRAHHLNPGFTANLGEYDQDLAAALEMIRSLEGPELPGICVAHSTGGLVASLWANRHPGEFTALVLNSPWLEMQGSYLVRYAAQGVVEPIARLRPRAKLHLPELDNYWRSLSRLASGSWDLHPVWRPAISFPVTAGWITAVMAGHREVARGLDIGIPVLVLTSKSTHLSTGFDESMLHHDTVIEVQVVRERSVRLGPQVSNAVIDGAMHDVFSSLPGPRAAAYAAIDRWGSGYMPGHGVRAVSEERPAG
ncbi:alpha/beta hydrolase [Arthrobacter sp. AQ5-05]|uniref:alpha/beta hydrolase n=1 Tax=Arthrobacter sp. AQ5-05 TaxID=2184581 RepID=UPI000DCBAEB1|nr:alpha/beta hydrolase [Arthrobacter sp. AQ5-05]RAX49577.1 alpha/beta hydrolase [Arthrobacter sp. AQ5-05]